MMHEEHFKKESGARGNNYIVNFIQTKVAESEIKFPTSTF